MTNSLPQDFLYRMQEILGKEYETFLKSYETANYQAFRLNTRKTDAGSFFSGTYFPLPADFHACQSHPVSWTKDGFYYPETMRPGKHPYHEAGVYYIQEPSAMLPAVCLDARPGERVLDLCAAPGGKSTQIAGAMQGKGLLISNEIHPARAKILSENIERMGISNAIVTNESPKTLSARFPSYFDRIMVDAPCSGEGMFRKNEEACAQWSLENVKKCAERQDEILDCADLMLRPGGRLVYSTCTFAPDENEGSVSRFLARHPEYRIVPVSFSELMGGNESRTAEGLPCCPDNGRPEWGDASLPGLADTIRLWPHKVRGEGHFAAVLEKSASAPGSDSVPAFSSTYQLQQGKLLASGKVLSDKAASGKALSAGASTGKALSGKGKSGKTLERCPESKRNRQYSGKAMPSSASELLPLAEFLADTLTLPLSGNLTLFGEQVYLLPEGCPSLSGLRVLRPGLHLGTLLRNRFEPAHALALYLKPEQVKNCYHLHSDNEEEFKQCLRFINGEALPAQGGKGWYLVCIDGYSLGWGKLAGSLLKNHYPKGLRKSLT